MFRPLSKYHEISLFATDAYHRHRLHSGIAEGVEELPVGNCLPLEYNLDYLNGGVCVCVCVCRVSKLFWGRGC